MASNSRASVIPMRISNAPPTSREAVLAKRREYLALCAIAEYAAHLENNLKATAQQQALMTDGGAALSKAMGNWLVIMRTIGMYSKEVAAREDLINAEQPTDTTSDDPEAHKRILLRVELNEQQ
ncbi:SubName: Full=Uncharacterized protein {ECO:0000313/EMBL:CCA73078.1} [Serendipita indica DSM 11827]|uniref:Uncharacterized protein n=1 Tax=Serendipita indica (strain DSM 11827) TaxID=1109443 RepID=G4TP31_SERID|nr:SubName: Full=Uncharacterized protein {ECO:0000313/EMBL:CCA73078.1} [Serendipita indica DSM 11827]CCA73078.1 hypothetical protein PIIN_11790 [Serendipita indica DSM 11827]